MHAVIFDIDGTLADLTHRLHHVKGHHKNYDKFFTEVKFDQPITDVCNLAKLLADHKSILLVSGRPEKTRIDTEEWMKKHEIEYDGLFMRPDGDFRPDYIIKEQILDGLLADGFIIDFVVDDRPSVVNMWRDRGLTCLQCREWDEIEGPTEKGLLTLMVGPSCAGKSSWLGTMVQSGKIHTSHIISSDQIRADLCGNFRDQTKNDTVFAALRELVSMRLKHGLDTIVDATNLRRKDRLGLVDLAKGGPVKYLVINRSMEEKYRDSGWRKEVPFDFIAKHEQTFNSQLKDIVAGDNQPNVKVVDLRNIP